MRMVFRGFESLDGIEEEIGQRKPQEAIDFSKRVS